MNSKLLETVADIAYFAGHTRYYSGDSRADMSNFVLWAKEFENIHKNTNWENENYMLTIETFASDKLTAIE